MACAGLASFTVGILPGNATVPNSYTEAFSSLNQLDTFTQLHPGDFAGVYVDPHTKAVHVDVVSTIASSVLAQMRQSAADSNSITVVFDIVPRNYNQLAAVMNQVKRVEPWASDSKNLLSSWSIDPVTDTVRVGMTTVTTQLKQESRQTFGDAVTLYQQDRMTALDRYLHVTNPKLSMSIPRA